MISTLTFLKTLQQPDGSFLGWPNGPVYPEITGYLIPTLLKWKEPEMAHKAAEYLIATQNPDGSWDSVTGEPTAFDTSACVEGLSAIGGDLAYQSLTLAIAWIKKQKLNEIYHVRTKWIVGIPFDGGFTVSSKDRVHYFAYALEGAYWMKRMEMVMGGLNMLKRGLQPRTLDGEGSDSCATAQVAYIRLLCGLSASDEHDALLNLVNTDGSFPHDMTNPKKVAWACKYYLDFLYARQNYRKEMKNG